MTTLVHGTCHHDCPDSCGWHVTTEERDGGRVAVQLRGNPAHPYSKGELCPKVNRFIDRVYSPDRVLHPLRRTGPKGSGEFEQITWARPWGIAAPCIDDRGTGGGDLPYSDAGTKVLAMAYGDSDRPAAVPRSWQSWPYRRCRVKMTRHDEGPRSPGVRIRTDPCVAANTPSQLTSPTIEAAVPTVRASCDDPIRTMTADAADGSPRAKQATRDGLAMMPCDS